MTQRKIPAGIEELLGMAAVDDAFAAELQERRETVVESSALQLAPTERALLASIDGATLERLIAGVRENLPDSERRAFLSMAANVALGLAAGGAVASSLGGCIDRCVPTKGIQPDRPPKPSPPTGSRPDRPPKPTHDHRSVGKGGVRADRPKKNILDEE